MIRLTPVPAWIWPAASAAGVLALFATAGWNALQAGILPSLVSTALHAQPLWFCH